jgi:hypothetical protein
VVGWRDALAKLYGFNNRHCVPLSRRSTELTPRLAMVRMK